MEPEIDLVRVTDSYVLGAWRRLAIAYFDHVTDLEAMEGLRLASLGWLREHPGRTVDLIVVAASAQSMSTAQRRKMATIVKETEHNRLASATVLLAEGLTGSVHRSIVTGFNLIAPPPHPAKVFGSVRDALRFLAPFIEELCGSAPTLELERSTLALARYLRRGRDSA